MAKPPKADDRIHISMPPVIKQRLEELCKQTGAGSLSELVRDACKLYALAVEEHKKGSDLLIRTKDGDIEKVRIFL